MKHSHQLIANEQKLLVAFVVFILEAKSLIRNLARRGGSLYRQFPIY